LPTKIAKAQAYLAANDLTDTCVTLSAFINQVNAQLGRSIPPPTAIEFTAQASRIKTMLSCGP
jgi:hypothetical protein